MSDAVAAEHDDRPDRWWYAYAVCRVVGPNLFYGPARERLADARAREARAKTVCAVCPVRQQCLETALATNPNKDYGVWGGTSREERREMRGMRRRT